MKNYLDEINNQFPIRRSNSEKEAFRNYVVNEMAASGHSARVETHKKHHNIIIGDIDKAKVIFTAHYKVFDCGIGVMTCKKKNGIFYTNKIHTNKDTEAYAENVDFLVDKMVRFVDGVR